MSGCEWCPAFSRPAFETDKHHAEAEATVSVGASIKNNWHLCASCAALPRFKRLKKYPLRTAHVQEVP